MKTIRRNMKTQFFLLASFFIVHLSFGQKINNSLKKDSTNIYYDAVKRYFNSKKNMANVESTTVLFEESYFTQFIPKKVGGLNIVVKNPYEKKLFKKIRKHKQIEMLRISPLKVFPSGKFKISIVYFDVSSPKRKNLHFINKGGVDMIYTYDNSKNEFIFEVIE